MLPDDAEDLVDQAVGRGEAAVVVGARDLDEELVDLLAPGGGEREHRTGRRGGVVRDADRAAGRAEGAAR